MRFLHPSPYEFGGSPDIEAEDALLAANGIRPYTGTELGLIPLEDTTPVDGEFLTRSVYGFSVTAGTTEAVEEKLGILDAGERLQTGIENTFYDRISGTAQIHPDGTVTGPYARPL